jgi:N-acetylglucosaminyldiphosphoundecaprenol N-acetyl-beta-D-mannosaminyltransferase
MINIKLEAKLRSGHEFADLVFGRNLQTIIVSFVNPYSYNLVSQNNSIIDCVDYWFSDGALLCFLTNLSRNDHITRASFDFSSIANEVFLFASTNDKRVSFVGGADDELNLAVSGIKRIYPSLNVVGKFGGFFKNSEAEKIANEISRCRTEILIVGMGSPAQENFSILCKNIFYAPCIILTCGGFITQSAIKSDYYHPVVKKLGLRWLQRAYDFKHVRKRLFFDYPYFVSRYIFDILSIKLGKIFSKLTGKYSD